MKNIGVLGLGVMGSAVAQRLLDRGFGVSVWNRSPSATEALAARGARVVSSPAALLDAELVISLLFDDTAVREVFSGDWFTRHPTSSAIHVCASTLSQTVSRELANEHARAGMRFLAAPVLGRPEVIAASGLHWLLAGDPTTRAAAEPALSALGTVWALGDSPHVANVAKLAANFLIGASLEALSEASALIAWHGGEAAAFVEMLTRTLFAAPIYQRYAPAFLHGTSPGAPSGLALPLKDLGATQLAAAEVGGTLPMAAIVHEALTQARDGGASHIDWSVALATNARSRRVRGA